MLRAVLFLFFALSANAAPLSYSVTVSSIPLTPSTLILTLTDGGTPANTMTVFGLTTTGINLGSATSTGDASGGLPGTLILSDTVFYSDYQLALQPLSAVATFPLIIAFSNNAPDTGSFPDGFALYLLDANFDSVLLSTDPTGAQALLSFDGGGEPNIYNNQVSVSQVPLPSSLLLFLLGGIGLVLRRRVSSTTGRWPSSVVENENVA